LVDTHIPQFTERKNRFYNRQDQVKGEFSGEGIEDPKPARVLGISHEYGGDQSLQSIEKSSISNYWDCLIYGRESLPSKDEPKK